LHGGEILGRVSSYGGLVTLAQTMKTLELLLRALNVTHHQAVDWGRE